MCRIVIYPVDSTLQCLKQVGPKQDPDLRGNMSSVWNQTTFRKETSGVNLMWILTLGWRVQKALSLWYLENENFIYSPYPSIKVQICLFLEI